MRRRIYRLYDWLLLYNTPHRVALGATFGFVIGLHPTATLQVVLTIVLTLLVRVQVLALLAGAALGYVASWLLAPPLHYLGKAILLMPGLHRLWSGLAHWPIFPFSNFNQTYVMGSFALCAFLPLGYFGMLRLYGAWRARLQERFRFSRFGERWFQSPFVLGYLLYHRQHAIPVHRHGWFRKSGVLALLGSGVVGIVGALLFGEAHLKHLLEDYAGARIGGRVTIATLQLNPWRGTASLRDTRVALLTQPGRDLVQIDQIDLNYRPGQLFSQKLLITDVHLSGVRFGGGDDATPPDDLVGGYFGGASVFDRLAPGIFVNLKESLGETPFARLGFLVNGLDLRAKLESTRNDWIAHKELIARLEQLENDLANWDHQYTASSSAAWLEATQQQLEKAELRLSAPHHNADPAEMTRLGELTTEISARFRNSLQLRDEAREAQTKYADALRNYPHWIDSDVQKLKSLLSLPKFRQRDITAQLFGSTVLEYLQRAAYWSDLTRRRMSAGHRIGMCTTKPIAPYSQEVAFGKMSVLPAFVLESARIDTEPDPRRHTGTIHSTFTNLTTDPPVWGVPAEIDLEANLPESRIMGLKVRVDIDHIWQTSKEQMTAAVETMPIRHWTLFQNGGLKIEIASADLRAKLETAFEEDTLDAKWQATLARVVFNVESPHSALLGALNPIFARFPVIESRGRVWGKLDHLNFEMESNLGKEMPELLAQEFHNALAAVDDNLRSALLDENEPKRQLLEEKLSELEARIETAYAPNTTRLERLLASAHRLQTGSNISRRLGSTRRK